MSKIYHSNGNLAYEPYPDYPKVYHSNGNLAYDPYSSVTALHLSLN